MIRACAIAVFALFVALPGVCFAASAEVPLDLSWAKLVPPAPAAQKEALKMRSFLSGDTPFSQATSEPPPPTPLDPEAPWMSRKRLQPGTGGPLQIVTALDGKLVRIGGYVVPLDFDATSVKEFLLVPFVGACIHVPPPPPNQIIYVKSAKGFEVTGAFDPVWVTGRMQAKSQYTGLAETGYSIEADKVETRKE